MKNQREQNKNPKSEEDKRNPKPKNYLGDAELKVLRPLLKLTLYVAGRRHSTGAENTPEELLKLLTRTQRSPSKKLRFSPGDYASIKEALESNSRLRTEIAEWFLEAHRNGVKLNDWKGISDHFLRTLEAEETLAEKAGTPPKNQPPDADDSLSENNDGLAERGASAASGAENSPAEAPGDEATSKGKQKQTCDAELAELARSPAALFLIRPKGWKVVYKLHIQVEEVGSEQKKQKEQIKKQDKQETRQQKEIERLKTEKGQLNSEIQRLQKQPANEAVANKNLTAELSKERKRSKEYANRNDSLKAELSEAKLSKKAAREEVRQEQVKWDKERSRKDKEIRKLEGELQQQTTEHRENAKEALDLIRQSLQASQDNRKLRAGVLNALKKAARMLEVQPESSVPAAKEKTNGSRPPAPRYPANLPDGIHENSEEAADYLCLEEPSYFILDGYNVIFHREEHDPGNLPKERARLRKELEELYNKAKNPSLVIYDGKDSEVIPTKGVSNGVQEMFSVNGEKADSCIIRECERAPRNRALVVVSADEGKLAEDMGVRGPAAALGANLLYPKQFLHVLHNLRK